MSNALPLKRYDAPPSRLGILTKSGLSITTVPDDLAHVLYPAPNEVESEHLKSHWHRVKPAEGLRITLRAPAQEQSASSEEMTGDPYLIVRLSLQSSAHGWRSNWLRWSYAKREVPYTLSRFAVNAKDVLLEEGRVLQILVLAGETRTVYLECTAVLDRIDDEETGVALSVTQPGDYDFEIIASVVPPKHTASEATEGKAETVAIGSVLHLMHPPANLLTYLPALYSEVPTETRRRYTPYQERSFFERYLRGFEDGMLPVQTMLAELWRLYDTEETPADFLPWLATWVGLVLNQNWPELRRRRLIREAIWLYRWRGTRRGLERYLELYTGVVPQILDQPREGKRLGGGTRMGNETRLGNIPPHTFRVTLTLPHLREVSERVIRQIIESEKPAHTAYSLRILVESPYS